MLIFYAKETSNISVVNEVSPGNIKYSKNSRDWFSFNNDVITLDEFDKLYVEFDASKNQNEYNQFNITGNINIIGQLKKCDNAYNYYKLFCDCTGITSVNIDLFKDIALQQHQNWGDSMFKGCTNLKAAPFLISPWSRDSYKDIFLNSGVEDITMLMPDLDSPDMNNIPDWRAMGIKRVYISNKGKTIIGDNNIINNLIITNAGKVENAKVNSIENSVQVYRCTANNYDNSFYSATNNNTYACADTLNGGFNEKYR